MARLHRSFRDEVAPPGSPFRPLHDGKIMFNMQPVALVVADSPELAHYAASLVHIAYRREPHVTDLESQRDVAYQPKERDGMAPPAPRGNAERALAESPVRVDVEYRCPVEHHNPMELFATTAVYHGDGSLTVFDKTQGVQNVRDHLTRVFGRRAVQICVESPFVGGAFGSGLRPEYQVVLAVLAALQLKRSVRVELTRAQMFSFGHRPAVIQRVALGAADNGALHAVIHDAIGETSRFEDYTESTVDWSGILYRCENARFDHRVAPLDVYTPIDMRAPGAVWGVYALECAMDELAVKLQIDPVELRLKNYSDMDQNSGKPFSSKRLRECYQQAGEKFAWSRRDPRPRSMRDRNQLVGLGMASAAWEAMQLQAAATALLTADGCLEVRSATGDIGTGTYTIMTQIAAELLGLPLEQVTFRLGDSSFPKAPVEGGSFTASTVGSAVKAVCEKVRKRVFTLARNLDGSPLARTRYNDVEFADGRIRSRRDPGRALSLAVVLQQSNTSAIQEQAQAKPLPQRQQFACYTHSAVFAEVHVDPDFGSIRVARIVSAVAGGRILNPKTARSQVLGGIVWGIGMALEEESVMDQNLGRFINHNLADYHVPVNADVHDIEVIFVHEDDAIVNPLGAKGLGEIGIVGVAAAIANAVYHATGKRIRELPITLDKLL
jgi:xanthine dehydrogenase YagR molybdenum-binding subunit